MPIKIICTKKAPAESENPYVAISHFSWIQDGSNTKGMSTRLELCAFVQNGNVAYISDAAGNQTKLKCALTAGGEIYVKSVKGDETSDELLKLPDCNDIA
jgi:hypothetical protein